MQQRFPKALAVIWIAIIMLFAVELTAQIRSHVKFGQSIFARATKASPYVKDEITGLTLLRPNFQSGGQNQIIRSNSFGLRSNEIPQNKSPLNTRILVMGASTVMGAYASENSKTFPALLETRLNQSDRNKRFEVINGGIAGLTLKHQTLLFDKLLAKFEPDITIVYSGFNDFATYCQSVKKQPVSKTQPLTTLQLPKWLLSIELLLKNTVPLRSESTKTASEIIDADKLDITNFKVDLEKLLNTLKRHNTQVILLTNAKSYRTDQPKAMQESLSETARFYYSCFDLPGLHRVHDRHNELIINAATNNNLRLFRLDESIPGGQKYFADATHFSEIGEQFVAAWLADQLHTSGILSEIRQ